MTVEKFRNTAFPGKSVILLLICLSISLCSFAAPLTITAKLDSAYIIMGQKTNLNIQVVKDRKTPGHFPMFSEDESRLPYVSLNNDTIELSRDFTSDTIDLGAGRTQINYRIPLQSFDSGFYHLLPIKYVAGSDTAESNRVALKVVPVNATADEEIAGLTGVAEPKGKSFFDSLPDWLYYYWWIIVAALVVIAVVVIYLLKYKKTGQVFPRKKAQLPPYQEAVKALKELKSQQLWQKGEDDEYFTRLTDILRRYILRRFGVAAPEMTSTQFLEEASRNEKLAPYKASLEELLRIADFVKFANAKSLPDENEKAFAEASRFVETTKPTQEEEQQLKAAEANPVEKATLTGKKIKHQTAARSRDKKQGAKKTGHRAASGKPAQRKNNKGKEGKK